MCLHRRDAARLYHVAPGFTLHRSTCLNHPCPGTRLIGCVFALCVNWLRYTTVDRRMRPSPHPPRHWLSLLYPHSLHRLDAVALEDIADVVLDTESSDQLCTLRIFLRDRTVVQARGGYRECAVWADGLEFLAGEEGGVEHSVWFEDLCPNGSPDDSAADHMTEVSPLDYDAHELSRGCRRGALRWSAGTLKANATLIAERSHD